jgi:predicted DNA-binding transcriptional regulator YafY
MEETDEEHGVTMEDILSYLDSNGVSAERKSIYDDFDTLRDFGFDILSKKSKTTEYYIASRDFEHEELTLLVDAVQSSRFLTEKKSAALIRKLEKLTSRHLAKHIDNEVYVVGRIKAQNESIYYNLNTIQSALSSGHRLSFQYSYYDMHKKKVPSKDGKSYLVDPIGLTYVDENYYLITYNEKWEDLVTYRVDRMMKISVTLEPATKPPKELNFDLADYCKRAFNMFDGEKVHAELLIHKSLVNAMIDRFGKDVQINPVDDDTATVHVPITASGPFFGWLTQFGQAIAINAPEELAVRYKEYLEGIAEMY